MKLFIDGRLSLDRPNAMTLSTALGTMASRIDAVTLLKKGHAFVSCWTRGPSSFQVQIRDENTCVLFEPKKPYLSFKQVAVLFHRFLEQDANWRIDYEWVVSTCQMTPEQISQIRASSASAFDFGPIFPERDKKIHAQEEERKRLIALSEIPVALPSALEVPTPIQTGFSPSKDEIQRYGPINPKMLCPHCASRGTVHIMEGSKSSGVVGAKVAAAFLTLGASVLFTGLSDEERFTVAHCNNCDVNWKF